MTDIFQSPLFRFLFVLPWIVLVLYTLRPGGAEKSYFLNKKYLGFLLPGKWKERDYFVRWTRRLGFFWLTFFLILAAALLFS